MRPRERGEAGERTTVLAELREGWSRGPLAHAGSWAIVLVFSIGLLTGFGPYMTLGPTVSIEH